jgi:hypothetical protein
MLIDRRTFIQSATYVASSSALAYVLPLSTMSHLPPARPVTQSVEEESDGNLVLFKIDGWALDTKTSTDNEVLIRISHSWRAAWR